MANLRRVAPKEFRRTELVPRDKQTLTTAPPQQKDARTGDAYVSDPAKPVPFTEKITPRMTVEYMVEDQRFAARRPDVLSYQTPVLEKIWLSPVHLKSNYG